MGVGYDRYTPEGERFMKELAKLAKQQVRIGFQAGKKQEKDGADLAIVALANELGVPEKRIPSRPFLRQTAEKNEKEICDAASAKVKRIAAGADTAESTLKALGALVVGMVRKEIKDGKFEENTEATIKRKKAKRKKKGDNAPDAIPLVDTGTMRESVHYYVVQKGEYD